MVYIMSLCCMGQRANTKHNQWLALLPRLQDTPVRVLSAISEYVSMNLSRTKASITK